MRRTGRPATSPKAPPRELPFSRCCLALNNIDNDNRYERQQAWPRLGRTSFREGLGQAQDLPPGLGRATNPEGNGDNPKVIPLPKTRRIIPLPPFTETP